MKEYQFIQNANVDVGFAANGVYGRILAERWTPCRFIYWRILALFLAPFDPRFRRESSFDFIYQCMWSEWLFVVSNHGFVDSTWFLSLTVMTTTLLCTGVFFQLVNMTQILEAAGFQIKTYEDKNVSIRFSYFDGGWRLRKE